MLRQNIAQFIRQTCVRFYESRPRKGFPVSKGLFFSFEGIDGVGKTTQQERFVAWLQSQGRQVVTCRDPGTTPLGESLRDILLQSEDRPIGSRAELLLYMAARAQLADQVIGPALESGSDVVTDRFLLSTLAYQLHARDGDVQTGRMIGQFATGGRLPDLVFLLDLDPTAAAERRHAPADRIEARGNDYLARVRNGYLAEAVHEPNRIVVVDAAAAPDVIQAVIQSAAEERIQGR